nr:hypothetical protein [Croceicoccus sp. YJ47]
MIADEIALRPFRPEPPVPSAGLGQRGEEFVAGVRAEPVQQELHRDPAPRRGGERIAHPVRHVILGKDVETQAQRAARPRNQVEQRVETVLSRRVEGEAMPLRLACEGRRIAIGASVIGERRIVRPVPVIWRIGHDPACRSLCGGGQEGGPIGGSR